MARADLRSIVQDYVNAADARLLEMTQALAESYLSELPHDRVSAVHYEGVDKIRDAHLNDDASIFTWDQVKENVRNAYGTC